MATITNLYLDQGSDFNITLTLTSSNGSPLDLTGYTASSQMRKSYGSSLYYEFLCTIIDELEGKIKLEMTAADSDNIKPGRWLYDVEITHKDGRIKRVVEGAVIVTGQITRTVVDEGAPQ